MKLNDEQQKMVTGHSGLIGMVLTRYLQIKPNHVYYDDYFQDGFFWLSKAAMHFKPEKGFQFTTYATQCILRGLIRALRLNHRGGIRGPLNRKIIAPVVSSLVQGEFRIDIAERYSDEPTTADDMQEVRAACRRAALELTDYESKVIHRLCDGANEKELASEFGVTRQSVNQAKHRAISRIRKYLEGAT